MYGKIYNSRQHDSRQKKKPNKSVTILLYIVTLEYAFFVWFSLLVAILKNRIQIIDLQIGRFDILWIIFVFLHFHKLFPIHAVHSRVIKPLSV